MPPTAQQSGTKTRQDGQRQLSSAWVAHSMAAGFDEDKLVRGPTYIPGTHGSEGWENSRREVPREGRGKGWVRRWEPSIPVPLRAGSTGGVGPTGKVGTRT